MNENERSIETAKATAAWFNVLFNDMPERLQDGHNPLGDDVLVVGVVVRVVVDGDSGSAAESSMTNSEATRISMSSEAGAAKLDISSRTSSSLAPIPIEPMP
jgi:cytochrome b